MGTKVFFLERQNFVSYDRADDRVDEAVPPFPRPITERLNGIEQFGFGRDLDTAVN